MEGHNIRCTPSQSRFFGLVPLSRRVMQEELAKRDSIIDDLKTALGVAEIKATSSERDAKIAQDTLEDERCELGMKTKEIECLHNRLRCLCDNITDLAAGNFENVYESICGDLDPEGWQLYWAAGKYTGVDPSYALSLIHISEPTRPERISYAVFCLKKKQVACISVT